MISCARFQQANIWLVSLPIAFPVQDFSIQALVSLPTADFSNAKKEENAQNYKGFRYQLIHGQRKKWSRLKDAKFYMQDLKYHGIFFYHIVNYKEEQKFKIKIWGFGKYVLNSKQD